MRVTCTWDEVQELNIEILPEDLQRLVLKRKLEKCVQGDPNMMIRLHLITPSREKTFSSEINSEI